MSDLFNQPAILKESTSNIVLRAEQLFRELNSFDLHARIFAINSIREILHQYSPFKDEPVDFVRWIPADEVEANDYNPNAVAPPEMKLLEHSISEDGYTQPIVGWFTKGHCEVVDGFHRNRVGKESEKVKRRLSGYLPVTLINELRHDRGDRIAATIRHNRARGKHQVGAMADIVVELKRRNWSDEKIGRELGMDPDEVLRLTQITGLAEMFKNQQFSEAWEIDPLSDVPNLEIISDIAQGEIHKNGRIYHTWEKWECYQAGFYEERPPDGMNQHEGEESYRQFLADLTSFEKALLAITDEWQFSCEHYLTNDRMNRVAWLGQASVAFALHIPSCCRGGYHLLNDEQKQAADEMALKYLNRWLLAHGKEPVSLETARGRTEVELY